MPIGDNARDRPRLRLAAYKTKAIVLANGVAWRRLSIPGADALLGRGVYYGVVAHRGLWGALGKDVVLIGGGNSAGQAAMLFSGYARSVTIMVRCRAACRRACRSILLRS